MELKPFFCYYGGKWRIAPKYPSPRSRTIIEPFAGAAGYSIRHHTKDVILYEKDPVIAGLWEYLISTSASEIRKLPLEITDLRKTDLPTGAKWLIGFWLNKGNSRPCNMPGKWMRAGLRPKSNWSKEIRERIAYQIPEIRHWIIRNESYQHAPDIRATWFIDPPYRSFGAGRYYKFHVKNYRRLAEWCRSRRGQVMVCEGLGAEWLPFREFIEARSNNSNGTNRWRTEMVWENNFVDQRKDWYQ